MSSQQLIYDEAYRYAKKHEHMSDREASDYASNEVQDYLDSLIEDDEDERSNN